MSLFIFGFGLVLLPILFRLALKLRLGIPMLYAVLMLTAFHGWYQAHTALAELLVCRVRQARACGQSAVSTEGLF